MALPEDKVYNSCLPFSESHQKLLTTVLIMLGLFALMEYAIKLIALFWIHFLPFLNRINDACFKKGGRFLKALRIFSSTKRLWKGSSLLRNCKKLSNMRFRCIVDPVKVTVRMGKPREHKTCYTQVGRKNKAYSGEWSKHNDEDEKKATWYRNQQRSQTSPCSSNLSGTETPQPTCPVGSVASWVRFNFSSPDHVTNVRSSSTHDGVHTRNQRATGDKPLSSEVAGEGCHGQRFLPHSVGFNMEEPTLHHLEQLHEPVDHQSSENNFIPSPILPGPSRVVYSALASDTVSRTRFNSDNYTYPHSPRGPQHRLGLEWHQRLPIAQQAEVYVYLVSPPPPSPEHNAEQPNHPFSAPRTISGKDGLANRISLSQSRGSSSQGPMAHMSSEAHKQRKSIWERKHQRRPLQPTTDYEKLAGSSGGANLDHHETFPHNLAHLADRGRGGPEPSQPTPAS